MSSFPCEDEESLASSRSSRLLAGHPSQPPKDRISHRWERASPFPLSIYLDHCLAVKPCVLCRWFLPATDPSLLHPSENADFLLFFFLAFRYSAIFWRVLPYCASILFARYQCDSTKARKTARVPTSGILHYRNLANKCRLYLSYGMLTRIHVGSHKVQDSF